MKITYYTIDDLRLEAPLRTERRFLDLEDALERYLSQPEGGELGAADGRRALPLIRRVPLPSGGEADALVADRLLKAPWRCSLEVLAAARRCVSALEVRYCLDRGCLVPRPGGRPQAPCALGPPAVRRAYVAGSGWISPAELLRRAREGRETHSYPLVLRYQADIWTEDGAQTVEVDHWTLRRLEVRAGDTAVAAVR